jgi:tRNA(His) 5'-end guanylyltransferase
MNDSLGDRMKLYEAAESGRRLLPLLPVLARIDGRSFSAFTRGLERPFDARLSRLMVETTCFLVEETVARCGYTQSDEISLAWYSEDPRSQIFFDGRVAKMTSQLAALATAYFLRRLADFLPAEYAERMPTFDARVWVVPTLAEAANCFLWREQDATKNSISMAARAFYSHAELHGKDGRQMQEMLWQKGINWNDYPAFFRRGTYVRRETVCRRFTAEELDRLPPRHAARSDPELVIERTEVRTLDLPPLGRVTNRIDVLFFGGEPAAEVRA